MVNIDNMPCAVHSIPRWKDYADRHGYTFVEHTESLPGRHPYFASVFAARELLKYGDVLLIDADTIPHPEADDIAGEIGYGYDMAAVLNDLIWVGYDNGMLERCRDYVNAIVDPDHPCINAGVIYLKQQCFNLIDWSLPEMSEWPYDQDWWNLQIIRGEVTCRLLGAGWNWMKVPKIPGIKIRHFVWDFKADMEDYKFL